MSRIPRITLRGDQRTDAWFAARCGRITASNLHCVMAKPSPRSNTEATTRLNYRVRVALEQITHKADREEVFKTIEMRRGEEREPSAAMHYEIATGTEIEHVQFVMMEGCDIGCSPDGLVGDDGMIETKCPNQATHLNYLQRTTVPSDYKWQVQGSLWICERQFCDFVSYHPDFPEELQLNILRVSRDEEAIAQLEVGCAEFLADVIKTKAVIEALMAQRKEAV